MRTILEGTEELTVEIDGHVETEQVTPLLDSRVRVAEDDGKTRVSMMIVRMRGLKLPSFPVLGQNYNEVLFRVEILVDGKPAWLATSCLIDRAFVRGLGSRLIRYPTRAGQVDFGERDGELSIDIVSADDRQTRLCAQATQVTPPPLPPRRLLVSGGKHLYEIPWAEVPAPERHDASVRMLSAELDLPNFGGPVDWGKDALIHRGRIHRCGLAQRLKLPSESMV